jgi:hypothetical protein
VILFHLFGYAVLVCWPRCSDVLPSVHRGSGWLAVEWLGFSVDVRDGLRWRYTGWRRRTFMVRSVTHLVPNLLWDLDLCSST